MQKASSQLLLALAALLSACAHQAYQPQPLDAAADAFGQTAAQSAGLEQLAQWDLNRLTQAALALHPDMQLARARWLQSRAGLQTAAQQANPEISIGGDHHSKANSASPWSFRLGLGIPVTTSNKREARVAQATALSEAARLDIAQTAWQVRSRVRNRLLEAYALRSGVQQFQQETATRAEIVSMLEKRLDAGYASNLDVSDARLQLHRAESNRDNATARLAQAQAALASAIGLPESALRPERLVWESFNQPPAALPAVAAQRSALQNRLDIRRGLAEYAAAEAEIRLEIARQTPDLSLGPSYEWDQGDNRWGLGLSLVLALFHNNDAAIAEASAKRETEAARFYQLQAQVIGQQEQAYAGLQAALLQRAQALEGLKKQQQHYARQQSLFDAGQIDRLELALARLETQVQEAAAAAAQVNLQQALGGLEDALQQALDGSENMVAGALPGAGEK